MLTRVLLGATLALFVAGATAIAQVPGPASGQTPGPYIPAGSEFDYAIVTAPLPVRQLGVIGLASLDHLRNPAIAVPSVLGSADDAPPAWPTALPAERTRRGKAPFAAGATAENAGNRAAAHKCKCATPLGSTDERRIAALYVRREFTVGDELATVTGLRLRARYLDGLVAHINGREVARRNLPLDAAPMAVAQRPRGPEWETFHIPVVPGLLRPGANVLAVEIRPSGRRSSPRLDLELTPVLSTGIVRGPMVQRVSATSAVVAFNTDRPSRGRVEYGPTQKLGRLVQSAGGGLAQRHVVELTGLPAGKPVYYRAHADRASTEVLSFHTAPGKNDVVRIAVYGDVRGGHNVHRRIADAIAGEAPDMVLVTGDLVLRGSDEGDWQRYFEVTGDLGARVPTYPVAGNHDMGRSGDQGLRMNEIFELWPGPADRPSWGHWYSFDVGDVHFVMLDSNAYDSDKQLAWLESDLATARARGVRAIFATAHDGPYSRGYHRGNRYAAEHYVPVLTRHRVTMMFSGHDHLYQRGEIDGFRYIVTGGGGAPLYSVRCGVKRRPRCKVRDGMQHVAKAHHYVMLSVYRTHVEVCSKRDDGTELEPCINIRLQRP